MARGIKGTGFIYPRRAKAKPDAPNGPRYKGMLKTTADTYFPVEVKDYPFHLFVPSSECLPWDMLRYAIKFPTPKNFSVALTMIKDYKGYCYDDMAHNCGVHRFTLRQWLVEGRSPPQAVNRMIILQSFLWVMDPDVITTFEPAGSVPGFVEEKKVDPGREAFMARAREILGEGGEKGGGEKE